MALEQECEIEAVVLVSDGVLVMDAVGKVHAAEVLLLMVLGGAALLYEEGQVTLLQESVA